MSCTARVILSQLHRASLLVRLVFLGTLLFIAVLALVAYVTREATRSTVTRINSDRLHSAEITAGTLDEVLRHLVGELGGIQALSDFDPSSPDLDRERLLLEALIEQGPLFSQGLAFLGPDGRVLAGAPTGALGPEGVPAILPSAYLRQALGQEDTYASPVFRDDKGISQVFITVPLAGGSGAPRGYLLGALRPSHSRLQDVLQRAGRQFGTGHADLLDAEGMVAASTERETVLTRGDHPDFYGRMIALGTAGIETVPDIEEEGYAPDENHVMAFVPLRELPWSLALGASESETYAPVRQFQRRVYLLALAVLSLVFMSALVASAILVRPVRVLSRSARRMAQGDLGTPITVREGGEIGELSADLEHMRSRLQASVEEIQALNRGLEVRIAERTQEVERQNRELVSVAATAESVSSSLNLQQVLETALQKVAEATGQQALGIFLLDEDGRRIRLAAAHGLPAPFALGETAIGCEDCLCGNVVTEGQPGMVEDIAASPLVTRVWCAAAGFRSVAAVPLYARDRAEGVLSFFSPQPRAFSHQDFRVATLICHQLGMAIQNARLFGALEEKEKQQRHFLERVINAQEEERKRLARELHDETGQTLTAIALSLESLKASLPEDWAVARERLQRLQQATREGLDELRRMVLALRPSALDDLGLVPAVRRYALQHLEPLGIAIEIEARGMDGSLDPAIQTLLFRVVQEAINNIARHAHARRASIRFWRQEDEVWAAVQDDGVGFDPRAIVRDLRSSKGLGLQGMQERARLVGGHVEIESGAGKGCRVLIRVPPRLGGDGA